MPISLRSFSPGAPTPIWRSVGSEGREAGKVTLLRPRLQEKRREAPRPGAQRLRESSATLRGRDVFCCDPSIDAIKPPCREAPPLSPRDPLLCSPPGSTRAGSPSAGALRTPRTRRAADPGRGSGPGIRAGASLRVGEAPSSPAGSAGCAARRTLGPAAWLAGRRAAGLGHGIPGPRTGTWECGRRRTPRKHSQGRVPDPLGGRGWASDTF